MLCLRLLVVVLSLAAQPVSFRFIPLPRETVERRLDSLPEKDRERPAVLRALFGQAGCATADAVFKGSKDPNVVCASPGETQARIVVGAHFDRAGSGRGAADNWSGAALLASLYQGLKAEPRRHTFVFVGFAAEESGLNGSRAFVKALTPEEKGSTHAMVNLDTLGLSSTKVWAKVADPKLVTALAVVAEAMKLPVAAVNVDNVGNSDSFSFRKEKIPVIDIHSVTQETLAILHSPADRLDAIRRDDYYDTYRLVLGYLVYLDCTLKQTSAR